MYRLFRKKVNPIRFIEAEKASHKVKMLCETLDVPRSTFYCQKTKKPRWMNGVRETIAAKIRAIHADSRSLYGKRRMQAALKKQGVVVSLYRVRKMMKELKLESIVSLKFKPKKSSALKRETEPVKFMFSEGFQVPAAKFAYSTDITYIKTRAGWKYLCVFMDMFSRKIAGYSFGDQMDVSLVVSALEKAIKRDSPPPGLIIHSDKGSQYTSKMFSHFCKNHGFMQSMSGAGACFDNAITETFNATIKKELIYQNMYDGLVDAGKAIFEYIEIFYNRKRLHSSLGYVSPVEYEQQAA